MSTVTTSGRLDKARVVHHSGIPGDLVGIVRSVGGQYWLAETFSDLHTFATEAEGIEWLQEQADHG